MADNGALFQPLQLGRMTLAHRLVMAPLTRMRATDQHVPTPMMRTYYAQRACEPGTLLISEATLISPRGSGFFNVPGIWTHAQIEAWKPVTRAVHAQGSYIYCQLWALGRAAKPKAIVEGRDAVAPSAIPIPTPAGTAKPAATPRALSEREIWEFVDEYAQAARNAIAAGFDGVEVHGANGYLVDQFNQDVSNTRTDQWGGSIEKRAKFITEVTRAVVAAVGADRVGMRLSPWNPFQGMRMADPVPQFQHIVGVLRDFGIAYLHLVEPRISGPSDRAPLEHERNQLFADVWHDDDDGTTSSSGGGSGSYKRGPVLLAGGFTPESARQCVDDEYRGKNVAVVVGRYWISNPDLAFRFKRQLELAAYDRNTFYTPLSPDGYLDYTFSPEFGPFEAKI